MMARDFVSGNMSCFQGKSQIHVGGFFFKRIHHSDGHKQMLISDILITEIFDANVGMGDLFIFGA